MRVNSASEPPRHHTPVVDAALVSVTDPTRLRDRPDEDGNEFGHLHGAQRNPATLHRSAFDHAATYLAQLSHPDVQHRGTSLPGEACVVGARARIARRVITAPLP